MNVLKQYFNSLPTQKLFVACVLLFMFLTRIVQKGMFGDGLLYSSMARNMAEGRGEWWKPFFSSSYWVPNLPMYYYENPPLMLWLQSLLFNLVGDFWWTEKLFGVLVFGANIGLMKWVWEIYFHNKPEIAQKWYILPLFWYLLPVVSWGNTNNLMDNLLLTFCLAAVGWVFKAILLDSEAKYLFIVLSSIAIFLGILVKGPVALYPLSLPVIFWVVKRKGTFLNSLLSSFMIFSISSVLFLVLIFMVPEASDYFQIYWEQRLKAVITGSRSDIRLEGLQRFYIVGKVFVELIPIIILVGLSFWNAKKKRIRLPYKDALIFCLLGSAATLPILASTKQSGIYLIPGLPMFSFAALILCLPFIKAFVENNFLIKYRYLLNTIIVLLLIFGIWQTYNNFGKIGREKEIISDLEILKPIIPMASKIGVCNEMMNDFVMHTYMQRMNKYELTKTGSSTEYLIFNNNCTDLESQKIEIYQKMEIEGLQYYSVYKKTH